MSNQLPVKVTVASLKSGDAILYDGVHHTVTKVSHYTTHSMVRVHCDTITINKAGDALVTKLFGN